MTSQIATRIHKTLRAVEELAVLWLAIFTAANLAMSVVSPRLGCNWIWINLSCKLLSVDWFLLLLFAAGVLAWRRLPRVLRIPVRVIVAIVGAICMGDAFTYYQLWASGMIWTAFPLPLSLIISALLLFWVAGPPDPAVRLGFWPLMARLGLGTWAAGFCLLAQVLTFGATDYRRPCDAIVVFGAGVYSDGSPSLALYDRTITACALYKQGLGQWVVLSGGHSPHAPISEPEAMKQIALRAGVPEYALVLDEKGANTLATIADTKELCRERGWRSVLMVSHDYHLSRINMLSHRAGLAAYTVPARESRTLTMKPYYVQRELVAWVYYYLKGRQ